MSIAIKVNAKSRSYSKSRDACRINDSLLNKKEKTHISGRLTSEVCCRWSSFASGRLSTYMESRRLWFC